MKKLLKYFVLLTVIIALLPDNIFPQTLTSKLTNVTKKVLTDSNLQQNIIEDEKTAWGNSFFLSGGYGTPQGLRVELGYNFGNIFSLAGMIGTNNNWSNGDASAGIIGKLNFNDGSFTVYILGGYGQSIEILGEPDNYGLVMIGYRIPLKRGIQVRPEMGIIFTSKHISGGSGLFGSSPETRENETKFGVDVSLEIGFSQIF